MSYLYTSQGAESTSLNLRRGNVQTSKGVRNMYNILNKGSK
jgi:hypothetical protein